MPNPTLGELEAKARAIVDAVRDDPDGRLALRERFYDRYPGAAGAGPGLGRSELDFFRWEIARGVLATPEHGGSPWWRAVNDRLLFDAELAALLCDELPALSVGMPAVRAWQHYIREPSAQSWYRAHDASVVIGYLDAVELAHAEPWSERVFMNIVLYRLLYAQALVEGDELGALGEVLANPAGSGVGLMLSLPDFYPRHYPLTKAEVRDILQSSHTLEDGAEIVLDDLAILPQLVDLYRHASGWLGIPTLERFLSDGKPDYPGAAPEPAERPHYDGPAPRPAPAPGAAAPKKIAILGGGLASLGAAYELTSYPGWQDRYDITLYQVGWRLGGKTASGFGPADRIEEKGIHIFQGWYNNAFRIVRDAYETMERHDLAPGSPLQKWTDAFVADDATLFTQKNAKTGEWTNWPVLFPYNKLLPGEGGPPPVQDVIAEGMGLVAQLVAGSPYEAEQTWLEKLVSPLMIDTWFTAPWEKRVPDWWKRATTYASELGLGKKPELRWLDAARDLVKNMDVTPVIPVAGLEMSALRVAVSLFGGFVQVLRAITPADRAADDRVQHVYVLAEFALANLRGFLDDVYDERTHRFDFGAINQWDYRQWLLHHGLPPDLTDTAALRFIYCGAFHNQYQGEPGLLGADLGLRSLLASVTYRGSLVWKLVAGTGGSLVAPIYKTLRHRGVKFEFFHDVEEIHWSPTQEIESITIGVQCELKGESYEPLQRVKDVDGWPAQPHYDQLRPDHAALLQEKKIDLESPWADWAPVREKTLRRGVDFDDVINGIPVRATEKICRGIVARSDSWKKMVEEVRTTPTIGVQLWLRPTLEELGLKMREWGLEDGDEPNSVIYEDLLYSWTDMGCVLSFEGWPVDALPGELSYYCGTWHTGELPPRSDHAFPARERERAIAYTRRWLDANMGWFFPRAIRNGVFDLSLLIDPADPRNGHGSSDGDAKLAKQWFVVNAAPSDQYTLAWPGSDRHRLRPDGSGFRNFFLCGDWTDFGLNIGHVEGAVTSGLVAGQCLLRKYGQTDLIEIYPDVGIPDALR